MTEQNYKGTPPPLSTSKKEKDQKQHRGKNLCVSLLNAFIDYEWFHPLITHERQELKT